MLKFSITDNSAICQKVFAYFLVFVLVFYQVCQFGFFIRLEKRLDLTEA